MRASYAFVLQKNNAEVSTYSVLPPTFTIEPKNGTLKIEFDFQGAVSPMYKGHFYFY